MALKMLLHAAQVCIEYGLVMLSAHSTMAGACMQNASMHVQSDLVLVWYTTDVRGIGGHSSYSSLS